MTNSTVPSPVCWVIAGPNGAGKTTFALRFLPEDAHCMRFINADLIAAGLSPLAPQAQLLAASRIFLNEIEQAIETRNDFAFETTLAGRGHLGLMRRLRAMGWRVELIYLAVPDAALSMQRVAERVAHGGHDIPAADIARRFPRSLTHLLGPYSEVADQTRCFMNIDGDFALIFEQVGPVRTVHHQANYRLIQQKAKS